jgi:hypothetical protein
MAAQPFMRPAFDAGANQALATIKDNLASEIEKARQRAIKKALKILIITKILKGVLCQHSIIFL